ncbi:MAG: DUF1351 domain-containing protein [Cetobacterium sp.]|uniref:DUF1351 domain-containing protein n=1 Tax=Cetobacterium sp. TaxID=2071632 RepID=UPI003EE7B888
MEVKALVEQQGIIKFNREEIEENLKRIEKKYLNLVFTEEEIELAKAERANLNNLEKSLATYRKDIVAEVTAPIKTFEDFMKDAEKRAKAIAKNIDVQIKSFEEKEKETRILIVKEFLKQKFEENQNYKEFENMFVLTDTIYTNKGSFTPGGKIASKLSAHMQIIFNQIEEILESRKVQKELIEQKKQLIATTCKSISTMLNLEIELDANNFDYLKNGELAQITEEIQKAGNRAKVQQDEKLEEIKKKEFEKAQQDLEKVKIIEEITINENDEKISKTIGETPKEKLFYAEFSIDGIPLELAKEVSAWLKAKGVKYTVKSQYTKMEEIKCTEL